MNELLKKLADDGCDIVGALERVGNDDEFLLTCLHMVLDDSAFEELGEGIRENNLEKGFNAAHSLKGACANTGLSEMARLSSDITEVLRAGSFNGLEPMYANLMELRTRTNELIA